MRAPFLRPPFLLAFQDMMIAPQKLRQKTPTALWRRTMAASATVATPPPPERISQTSTHVLADLLPIPSGKVLITDPCYEKEEVGKLLHYPDGALCNRILDCLPGKYQVRYTKELLEDEAAYAELVSLGIFHLDHKTVEPHEFLPPYVAVDGAALSFSDAHHKVPLRGLVHDGNEEVSVVNWHGTPVARCTTDDGGYPLLVGRDPEGRVVAAEVLFQWYGEEDEDHGEDYGDE